MINKQVCNEVIKELIKKYPDERKRIEIGVKQIATLWQKEDGDREEFLNFAINNFKPLSQLDVIFERFNENMEYIKGYLTALYLRMRIYLDEERGELQEVDKLFANFNPLTHIDEDMFKTKLAFVILLNYPVKNLKEIRENMDNYTRRQWAEIRLSRFIGRVPSVVEQLVSNTYSKTSEYVYSYYIDMSKIRDENENKIFDELKLISHWGLRDQIKLYYNNNNQENINRQKTIYKIMENIVYGLIPDEFIKDKNSNSTYNPFTLKYNNKAVKKTYLRYKNLLDIFNAHRKEDKYYLMYKTYIERVFNIQREITLEETKNILGEILSSDLSFEVAKIIEKNLNRKLHPFDIWYNGFRDNSIKIDLDEIVRQKYKTIEDIQKGLKDILIKLDFDTKTAEYLSEKIEVDPARGAGHAWGPEIKGEKAHLRAKFIDGKFLNWQSFNTIMHELGHCVEQIFTLYDIDYNLLSGVPNTAFTEAFAFVFQNKSLEVLGVKQNPDSKFLNTLQTFWDTREIAAVALVDIAVWEWMYGKQKFDEKDLQEKVVEIAKGIWNKYFAKIFNYKDSPVLAIYSHMIFHGLYLPDYPIGHIIAYQIEKHFEKISIGKDMKRMCQLGNITPAKWMRQATGSDISPQMLISDTKKAIEKFKAVI